VNLTGSKTLEKLKPVTTPRQVHRGANINLMKMRLTSLEDPTEDDDAGSPANLKETTDGVDSVDTDFLKGKLDCLNRLRIYYQLYLTGKFLSIPLQSSTEPETPDIDGNLAKESRESQSNPSAGVVASAQGAGHTGALQLSRRSHGSTSGTGHGLARSRSGRGVRPYSHPYSHQHGSGKSGCGDHSVTQFALIDDENVSALQQITRGGGGLTMASQWKSQFDDSEETDNEWKGEQLQSPEHKIFSFSQVSLRLRNLSERILVRHVEIRCDVMTFLLQGNNEEAEVGEKGVKEELKESFHKDQPQPATSSLSPRKRVCCS